MVPPPKSCNWLCQWFPTLVLEAPQYCTVCMSPFSDTPLSGLGVSTNELMTWIGYVWLRRHAKHAVLGCLQDQGWELLGCAMVFTLYVKISYEWLVASAVLFCHLLVMWRRSTQRLRSLYKKKKPLKLKRCIGAWFVLPKARDLWRPKLHSPKTRDCFSICFKRSEPQRRFLCIITH